MNIVPKRWQQLFFYAALALAIIVTFGSALNYGFAPIDDHHLISGNLAVRTFSWSSLVWFFTHFDPELYIPLTYTSFWIEHALAGLTPAVFHATNLLLHIGNTLLLLFIFTTVSKRPAASFVAVLLFALHPIQTETIVWISARKDLLATFFGLLSVVTALQTRKQDTYVWWIVSIALFVCALLSKISIAPLALLLVFIPEHGSIKKRLLFASPFVGLAVLFGIVAILGKTTVVASTSLVNRLLLAGDSLHQTLVHILAPFNLHILYEPTLISALSVRGIAAIGIPVLLVGLILFLRKRAPLPATGILIFLLLLAPTLVNIQADINAAPMTFAADRYAYLPMIGVVVLLFSCIRRLSLTTLTSIGVLLACVLIPLSIRQTRTWASSTSLYTHALSADPTLIEARTSLARTLREQGQSQEAFDLLREGLEFGDDHRLNMAAGYVFASSGQLEQAREQFTTALFMAETLPEALFALGMLAEYEDNTEEAIIHYTDALDQEPDFPAAHIALARLYLKRGQYEDSRSYVQNALKLEEFDSNALMILAELLLIDDRYEEAEQILTKAALIDPFHEDLERLSALIDAEIK